MELTLKYPRTPSKHFPILYYSGVSRYYFLFLKGEAPLCCAPVGFPCLLSVRRCRCVILNKACAPPSVFVINQSQTSNWLCQLLVSVLYPLKSNTSSLAAELSMQMCRLKFWATMSLWRTKLIVFL